LYCIVPAGYTFDVRRLAMRKKHSSKRKVASKRRASKTERRAQHRTMTPSSISVRLVQNGSHVFITMYEKYRLGGEVGTRPHPFAQPVNTFALARRAVMEVLKRLYPKRKKFKVTFREFKDTAPNPYRPPLGH
jgi:hypothetical protein